MHEQDGDGEPAHHARRPMNAFLIFCKRHRSVVRDKYPNLENRSITKILGEWWANLDKEDKACYTGLAKQYKDAFLSANPDFKWYKLPAPPLRTLSSRPREPTEKPNEFPNIAYHETELEKTNNNSTKVDLNKKPNEVVPEDDQKRLSMFTPGKLADEAHMGGLSSLLATKTETQTPNPYYSPPNFKYNAISTSNDYRSQSILETSKTKGLSREENIRELQNALTETSKIFEEEFDDGTGKVHRYGHGVSNDQFTNQDVIDQIVDKRYSKDDDNYMKNWSDDEKNSRAGRSCKGKRYQEFMAVGGLIVNKRQKRDHYDKMPDEEYNASCSWESNNSHGEESAVAEEPVQDSSVNDTSNENEIKHETPDTSEPDNNTNKTFKAADFDLDAKIRALPSLSLEKFQQKKRENKRKKKSAGLKSKNVEPVDRIINAVPRSFLDDRREMVESWREHVIGSQKRKPRKVSITRLDFNSMAASMEMKESHKISPEIKLATEAPCTVLQSMELCKQPPHSHVDLLALATLAEVAANKSKIEESSMIDTMTAKASEENASMV
ncbi:HMG box transcription factor BBX [Amyelois transitella]|uniref:HMG box transcription factor BBX n=1 Tax=Amyelois transitella TaxID=680683 RepID=UPI00067D1F12|nr:HMG box transcription factor BBX [Amyelois transitella]